MLEPDPSVDGENTLSPVSLDSPFSDELKGAEPWDTLDCDILSLSDSDAGRDAANRAYSSASDLEGHTLSPRRAKSSRLPVSTSQTSPLLSPKPKKKPRRKSRNSEALSERSHRSDAPGSGYTSTPATGKIFRNLLILEESLRQQVMQQRALRRKYLTFLAVLCSLIASISHHLYFNDNLSASVRVMLQLSLLFLSVTLMLYHLSGEYQKTIVLPRKFLSSTNKGLRQLNVRLVKIKTSFADSSVDLMRELGLFLCTMCLRSLHTIYPSKIRNPDSRLERFLVSAQLQCQPRFGLTDVKLTLLPRSFNTDIREGWELYRNEFWVNEGVRRRNAMMDFVQPAEEKPRTARKEKKDRRSKRKSSITTPPRVSVLSEENLQALGAETPEHLSY